jgi:hypothetical protein
VDAATLRDYDRIVFDNVSSAMQWFRTPPAIDENGDTTILHGIERVWGPNTLSRCEEVNQVIIMGARQAFTALQIKFHMRYVVKRFTPGGVPTWDQAQDYDAFDLYFSVSLNKGVQLRAPLTADIVQLATSYIETQLRQRALSTGLMLLGVVFPPGFRGSAKIAPSALFESVLKVVTPNALAVQPFVVERQTLLLSVLHELTGTTSPVGSINITAAAVMHHSRTPGMMSRRMLVGNAQPGTFYVGLDMVLVPAGPQPQQIFGKLLGDGRYKQMLAARGLPATLEWVNTTVSSVQVAKDGTEKFSVTVYPEPVQPGGRASSSLSAGAIVGIVAAGFLVFAAFAVGGLYVGTRRRGSKAATLAAKQAAWSGVHSRASKSLPPSSALDSASSYGVWAKGLRSPLPAQFYTISPAEIAICKREDGSDWLLGSGSFGQVYKGIRRGVQEVAVKKLRPATDDDLWFSHLDREIAILSAVSFDRNIVQYYGACLEEEDVAMLVMEFCSGGDLRQAFSRDETGEYAWCGRGRGIALDIARGLHFLHTSQVIHRDLKTSNILLTGEGVAKISDVGLAKIMTAADPGSWDKLCGTFSYAAPELILGVRCTEAIDIYSFGVVLWEICTHEMPIRGQLRDVLVPEEAPPEISRLIDECLQPNPAKRPKADDLYNRIKAIAPEPASSLGRASSSGPLARDIGRDNGQRWSGDRSSGSGTLPGSITSPGMVDAESLLQCLYNS